MSRLGIDFGTSYCTMAAWNDREKKPVVIRGMNGTEKIPTVIYWDAEGNHDIGEAAVNRWMDGETAEQRLDIQCRTIRSVKRNFSPEFVVPMPDGKTVLAVDIVAAILHLLKKEAEEVYFHDSVTSLCLTYPASFSTIQKHLLERAANNAGFGVVELLPEPIAAALGYASIHNNADELGDGVLVYDLGGGTLDLTYVKREQDGTWHIPIPPCGDPYFGGDDFDRILYEHAERTLLNDGKFSDDQFRLNMEVLQGCRDIKELLSRLQTAAVSFYHQNRQYVFRVNRKQFEDLIRDQITTSVEMTRQLLDVIQANNHTVDSVILIGGSSRIPLIRNMLSNVLPVSPLETMAADVAVALGAAAENTNILIGQNSHPANALQEAQTEVETWTDDEFLTKVREEVEEFDQLNIQYKEILEEYQEEARESLRVYEKMELATKEFLKLLTMRLSKRESDLRRYLEEERRNPKSSTVTDCERSIQFIKDRIGKYDTQPPHFSMEEMERLFYGASPGDKKTIPIKGIDYTFTWCPAGSFMMGDQNEKQHKVTLSRGFWILETQVTQAMWESVMGNNPSHFKGKNLPVEYVSWNDCQNFISKIQNEVPSGLKFRLPSEAQWEYACRAGTTGPYAGIGDLDEMGWYDNNSGGSTHEVKGKQPNAWGLYDMHGNVWEWCKDWYDDYPSGPVTDPTGPKSGSDRVFRGGSWLSNAKPCRSAYRNLNSPENRYDGLGFRLVLSSKESR